MRNPYEVLGVPSNATEEQIKMSQTSSGIYANKYVKINVNTLFIFRE